MVRNRGTVLGLASAAGFMIALDTTVVSTVLSSIRRTLGASVERLEWTVNAYVLSFGVLLLTGAALGDRFGRRRMFVAGIAVFTVASAACGLSPDAGTLIAARAVQGAGAALILPLAMTHVGLAFPAAGRGRALGVFTGVAGLATFAGPFVGGAVAQGLAWPWVFWLNVPIGVVLIGLILRHVPVDPTGASRPDGTGGGRLDVVGAALATVAALGMLWAMMRGNAAGWASAEVLGALGVGVAGVVAFARWERHTGAPMVPLRLFRHRAFGAANLANFCLMASMYGALFFLAQFLQTVLGYRPLGAGIRLMPWTGLLMIGAPIAGTLADRLGERRFLAGGLVLQGCGLGWLAMVAGQQPAYGRLLPGLLVSGLGIAVALPAAQKAAVGAVAPADLGRASGVFNALRQIGGAFGIAAAVAAFSAAAGPAPGLTPRHFADGCTVALAVCAALALAGSAVAALGTARRPEPAGSAEPAVPATA
jgi:EmrB/QacA subfamily drug resistance transporter